MIQHPTEEQMVDLYYAGRDIDFENHLKSCQDCSALYRNICETLEAANETHPPDRGADYGANVWARVSPRLPVKRSQQWRRIPAMAALLALAFAAGIWTERQRPPVPEIKLVQVKVPLPPVVATPVIATPLVATDREQDKKLLALNNQLAVNPKAALPQVVTLIEGDTSDRIKAHALFVLAQSDAPEAHQALLVFTRQPSSPELQTKAQLMLELKPVTAEKKQVLNSIFFAANSQVLLDELKNQPNPKIRVATIRSLGVMGEQSNILTNVYRTDNNDEVRRAVLDALVLQKNRNALSELAKDEPDETKKSEILARLATLH